MGILFAQFPFSGLWNGALGTGALPLRCPAPVGPSLEQGWGAGRWGSGGLGAGQVGVFSWRTVIQNGGAMLGCGGRGRPRPRPRGGAPRPRRLQFPRLWRRGWSPPSGRAGRAWGLWAWEPASGCTTPTSACDVTLRLVPCAPGPGDASPSLPDLWEPSFYGEGRASARAAGSELPAGPHRPAPSPCRRSLGHKLPGSPRGQEGDPAESPHLAPLNLQIWSQLGRGRVTAERKPG